MPKGNPQGYLENSENSKISGNLGGSTNTYDTDAASFQGITNKPVSGDKPAPGVANSKNERP